MAAQVAGAGAQPAVVGSQLARHPGGVAHRADVDHGIGIVAVEERRFAQVQLQFQLRVLAREGHQGRGQPAAPVAKGRGQAQRAAQLAGIAVQRVAQLLDLAQQPHGLAGKALALGRQRQAPRAAVGQGQAQFGLQPAQAHGQCRRCHVKRTGRRAQRAFAQQGGGKLQVFDGNHSICLND